ncbi:MAG: non-heme iron oxygenase ferredoxin subunit [Candidatus Zixiibacteriota bacterium]
MGRFVRVADVQEIPEGTIRPFEVEFTRFVIVHTADGFFAIADECSHDGAPFSGGRIRGTEIMCTRHGARFDLRTGAVTAPPAVAPIDTYDVKVEGNDVFIFLD